MRHALALAAVGALAACTAAGCTSSSSGGVTPTTGPAPTGPARSTHSTGSPHTSASPPTSSGSSPSSSRAGAGDAAQRVFDAMTEKQRVGQLLMVDCPTTGITSAASTAITGDDVGSVILDGTSTAGMSAIRSLTSALESANPSPAKLFIATDQEGGQVQRLQGSGFSGIPAAVAQGTLAPATLQADARTWGTELVHAGINVNLAPVLDTVPAGGGANPPIGDLDREYGHDPATVSAHGLAYARGMAAAGIDATVKHFPGLGRVTGNTDLAAGVTDSVTTRDDPYLAPFRAAVQAGVPFVMISTAIYSRIDPGVPAAFSHTIVTGMLRDALGFTGVVISDDVGAADQVADVPVGQRAVRFVQAGGDIVLTVTPDTAGPMTQALLARSASDPSFRKLVDAAALRVLKAKQARGLLG